ncbi:MAG: outer membrane protein assembly factor BamB family protein [Candidatus Binataceae bacterium]
MSRWIRWIIVAPVVMLACGTIMSSCGNNNGCFGSLNPLGGFNLGICAGPTGTPGYTLESISLCQIFATPSPTGVPSSTPTSKHPVRTPKPTPTPSATACPTPVPGTVFDTTINGTVQFEAQATLIKVRHKNQQPLTLFADITNSPNIFWGSYPSGIVVNPAANFGGIYTGQAQGCTCVSASSSNLSSLQFAIQVGSPSPACPPCPTPTFTPSPTASATPKGGAISSSLNYEMPDAGTAPSSAIAQWTVQNDAPVAGAIVPGARGEAYFITRDALLHAIDSHGNQIFDRPAGGSAVAVAPDGTIIVQGTTDWLYGLASNGIPRWKLRIGNNGKPLAADDSAAYVSVGDNLISVSSKGQLNWTIPASPAIAGAVIPGGVVIAAAGGDLTAYSTTGSKLWSFTPDGGFAGELAVAATTVYCGSNKGTLYAIDSDTGAQDWSVAGAAGTNFAGPVIDTLGQAYFGAGALYAVDSAGTTRWSAKPYAPAASSIAVDASGNVYVAVADGTITKLGANGSAGWSSHSAGKVISLASSPSGQVFVASADGRVSALK